jgi:hypothetical protein
MVSGPPLRSASDAIFDFFTDPDARGSDCWTKVCNRLQRWYEKAGLPRGMR